MTEHLHCDVAIVGGGMVGAALAADLAQRGFQVTLLEARKPVMSWPADDYDLRVSALTLASCRMLAGLGAWPEMQAQRVCPFQQMHVWDANGSGILHLDSADSGQQEMGFVVENRVTVAALWRRLQALPSVTTLCPAQLLNYQSHADSIQLYLDQDRIVTAQLLVGADGGQSAVRELAGIACHGWSYEQKALVATVLPEKSHAHTAWQRFLGEGPLALLPLPDNRVSIVWTAHTATSEVRLALSDADFCAELERASEGMLGGFQLLGPRAAFPLQLKFAERYIDPRIALVGDAIHTIHPLAGQGANLGLADTACLAEFLQAAHDRGRAIASRQVLRRYERARKGDNLLMMGAMDGLKRLYGNQSLPLQAIRSGGMGWINDAPWLKNWIARYAMGLNEPTSHFSPGKPLT